MQNENIPQLFTRALLSENGGWAFRERKDEEGYRFVLIHQRVSVALMSAFLWHTCVYVIVCVR